MHISFIIPDVKGGGAQKMVINLANEFAARGHQVDLVLFHQEGTYQAEISDGVNIVDFGKARALQAVFPLKGYIEKARPDVMMSAMTHVNLVAVMAKILSGQTKTKLVISERNHLSRNISTENILVREITKFLVKIFYLKADKIVGISNGVCDDLRSSLSGVPANFIQTIYNPVVTKEFEEKLSQDTGNVFPSNSGIKLVSSGRLVAQKDYPMMFRALALYKERYGDFHLVVLGWGAQEENLKNLAETLGIRSHISFLGFVNNPLGIIKQADIFVLSSAWEGFCNVLVEALYSGLKVVSTDCPSGPSEILENGRYGALVPVGGSEQFCDALADIEKKKIDPSVQKLRALDFTVKKISDQFEGFFQEVLES